VTLGTRDKRALAALGVTAAIVAAYLLAFGHSSQPAVVAASSSLQAAERRLAHARQLAASVYGKQQVLKQVRDELSKREKGILRAQTAPQAQAQLLDIARRVAKGETPRPIDLGNVELQPASRLGDYGEVRIALSLTCQVEDLVNFLADLTKQPEAIATSELRITSRDQKQKTIAVRLVVSGVVPRQLAPDKKGLATF